MSVERSIEIRLAEGVLAIFRDDQDVLERWKQRMFIGPWNGDDSSIVTPQINIIAAIVNFDPGVGGVSNTEYRVGIALFETYGARHALGQLAQPCWRLHLRKLLSRGSRDPLTDTFPEVRGQVVNPDAPTSPITTERFLTVGSPRFNNDYPRPVQSRTKQGFIADMWGFEAVYVTRENDQSIRK